MATIKENKFYSALENIFTGANIEGESGYVNLLKIKSSYYKLILGQFKKDVDNEQMITDSFKEEFFDKLYSFFEKYFSESGSVYFVKTANWQRVYEQVYTDNKDVVLFWKTHMLYYVKSDILFQSIDVEIEDEESKQKYNFFFDVGSLKAKQNNEKKALVFTFREVKEEKNSEEVLNKKQGKKTFVFDVAYSERGKKTKIDDIVKKSKIPEVIIENAFATFRKQSEVDFFINKNAEKFLTEQLDMYLHQILLHEENKFEQKRLDQIKTIKVFANKIINFISQFEDELVRIWNKPKFALDSNYVVTIDKLSKEILEKIAKHKNLSEQIKEWQGLGMVDESFNFSKRKDKYKFLPIDTKFFKDLEIEILGLFDDIDDALDGRLIHSENYQALNTLQEKYKGTVQCVYIDPPFNLDKNADFDYKVNYKDANWATLLENRIRIAHKLLSNKGNIFVRCDDNGNAIVRMLLNDIFGKENFRNEIIINRFQKKSNGITNTTESLFLYSKSELAKLNTINKARQCIYCKKENESKWQWSHSAGASKIPKKFLIDDNWVSLFPPKGRHWTNAQEKIDELTKNGQMRINNSISYIDSNNKRHNFCPERLQDAEVSIDDNWTDIAGYEFGVYTFQNFSTQNSEILLKRVIELSTKENDLVVDFFAGSATTQAVAQKLDRKWIGVEMGVHFNNIDVPRIKLVLNGDKKYISKNDDIVTKKGGFFKYYSLEQYEDTLRNMRYKNYNQNTLFATEKKTFEQYVFYADQKFAHVLELEKDKLEVDFDKLYPNIDFAETISNLLGMPIKKITKTSVILQDKEEIREIKTDYKNMTSEEKLAFVRLLKPLLWWEN
jgi:adenine-specific DNA-methyltransferase